MVPTFSYEELHLVPLSILDKTPLLANLFSLHSSLQQFYNPFYATTM